MDNPNKNDEQTPPSSSILPRKNKNKNKSKGKNKNIPSSSIPHKNKSKERKSRSHSKICNPFHNPTMPHLLPKFRLRHRRHAVKSSSEDTHLTVPVPSPDATPSPPSPHLLAAGCTPSQETSPPAPASPTATAWPPGPTSPTPAALLPAPTLPTCTTSPVTPTPPNTAASSPAPSPTAISATPPPDPPPPPRPKQNSTVAPETTTQSATRPSLLQPARKRTWRNVRIFRFFCSPFRSLPIIAPAPCKLTSHHGGIYDGHIHGGIRMTGTLFGHRKARVTLAIQENPRCLPMLLLEMAIPTAKLLQEMASGLVRIALECEKRPGNKTKLTDEPVWTMYCNGRKTGYGSKREPTDDDLHIMQLLRAVSMGAGVLPSKDEGEHPDGELTYMRAFFERVIGSKDSETFYMLNPDGNSGPELSIFFVRL